MNSSRKFRFSINSFFIIVFCFYSFASADDLSRFSRSGPEKFNQEAINYFLGNDIKGVLTAFRGTPEMAASRLQRSFYISGNNFLGEWFIINNTSESFDLSIFCLIDYGQTVFSLDGIASEYHEIEVAPGTKKTFTIEIDGIGEGAHDFIFLPVQKVKAQTDIDFRDIAVFSHRANIFAKKEEFSDHTESKADFLPQNTKFGSALWVDKYSNFGTENFSEEDKTVYSKNRLFLHINNPDSDKKLLLFAISGKKIIPVYPEGNGSLLLEIPENCSVTIPLGIDTGSLKSGNNLIFLSAMNPFSNLEPDYGVMSKIDDNIEIISRFAID